MDTGGKYIARAGQRVTGRAPTVSLWGGERVTAICGGCAMTSSYHRGPRYAPSLSFSNWPKNDIVVLLVSRATVGDVGGSAAASRTPCA